ncbi:MAG: hypothetical protein RBG13Loki_1693 [Promethearchaeota archaeon CR_4]|nr:MAG: hypothetical protein RBG13Loki_1693 [Candidatus Lokiarchaeota archaeon CR_4]
MEANELETKRSKAEEFLAAGKFEQAREVTEEIYTYAKKSKNRDLMEEVEYFNINMEEQQRRLSKTGKKVKKVVVTPEVPVEGIVVDEVAVLSAPPAQGGEGEIPWGKGILREKYRWTASGGEFLLKKAFLSRDAADQYCEQLQVSGKKSFVDFKLITVIRKNLASQYCFNAQGETFAIFER